MLDRDKQDPPDAQAKVHFLRTDPCPRRVLGHRSSFSNLIARLGNELEPRETYRDQVQGGKLQPGFQRLLATRLEFALDWPEWVTGTADDFAERYREHHKITEVQSGLSPLAPLRADWDYECKKLETPLGSLSLYTGQSAEQHMSVPGEFTATFDLHCPLYLGDGVKAQVLRGILAFDLGKGRTGTVKDRCNDLEVNNATLTVFSVDLNRPSWTVCARNGSGIGMVETVPHDFLKIFNLRPGNVISATFDVAVKNIETSFALPDAENKNAAKQKLKKRLLQLGLHGGEQGTALVAQADMRVVAKKD